MKKIFIFLAFFSIVYSENLDLPNVAIITTGGTIAEKTTKEGGSIPALTGEDLVESVPALRGIANIKVYNFSNIDSSQMSPQIWVRLSKVVDAILKDPKIKGAVITHGTDTMAEGAYFLDLTLKSNKPIVFTGAMKNATDPFPDGPDNLLNAVIQVISDKSYDWGVTVTLNQYINSAKSVEKTQTTNIQTFKSGEKGYLGYIFDGKVFRFNDRLYIEKVDIPKKLANVVLYTDYAGADGEMLRGILDKVDGIVVESFGSGNVNSKVFDVIKEAISKKIVVVVTSRVYHGGVFPVYGDKGGGKTLEDLGVI